MYKLLTLSFLLLQCIAGQYTQGKKGSEYLPTTQNDQYLSNFVQGLEELKDKPIDKSISRSFRSAVTTNLKAASVEEAKRITLLAGAAYCSHENLSQWKCNHCQKLGGDVKLVHIFEEADKGGRGYLALDDLKKQIIISFRGSANIQNWLSNIGIFQQEYSIPNQGSPVKFHVHGGFLDALHALQNSFNPQLEKLLNAHPEYKLIVTGHSLGGAIANLAAIEIRDKFNLSWDNIELYTYGQPRVGSKEFAEWFDTQTLTVARVVNKRDIVPHNPARATLYHHINNEIYLWDDKITVCKTNELEDKSCSVSQLFFLSAGDHLKYFGNEMGSGC
ncbi:alpha/beta-hydrolase [Neoconidiobolus thromboides FSU 785]|nr:alpha/beta-hydrolase [Neoconidiobolus thromboides FSU 785]